MNYWADIRRISLDGMEPVDGGGRGIRTPVTRKGKAVFKTACFNHSHIPPRAVVQSYDSDAASQSKERRSPSKLRQENLGSHAGTIVGWSSSHSGTYFAAFRHPLTLIWDHPIILARSLSGAFSSTLGLGPSHLVLYLLRFTSIRRSYESALSRGKEPNHARLHPSTYIHDRRRRGQYRL